MKQRYRIITKSKQNIDVFIADSFWERLWGLLGTKELRVHTGLILRDCRAIHMFFMPYGIDVVYVDKYFQIVKMVEHLKPWHISICMRAKHTIELPVGTITAAGWKTGLPLNIREVRSY